MRTTQEGPALKIAGRSVVRFTYVNWRGDRAVRTVMPLELWFGTSEHHPNPTWLLDAIDFDRGGEVRTFDLDSISGWSLARA